MMRNTVPPVVAARERSTVIQWMYMYVQVLNCILAFFTDTVLEFDRWRSFCISRYSQCVCSWESVLELQQRNLLVKASIMVCFPHEEWRIRLGVSQSLWVVFYPSSITSTVTYRCVLHVPGSRKGIVVYGLLSREISVILKKSWSFMVFRASMLALPDLFL